MDVPVTLIVGLCRKLLLPGESGVGFSFSSCIENPLLMSFWGKKGFYSGILLCFLRLLCNCLLWGSFKINITSVLYISLRGLRFRSLAIDFKLCCRTFGCTQIAMWWITLYVSSQSSLGWLFACSLCRLLLLSLEDTRRALLACSLWVQSWDTELVTTHLILVLNLLLYRTRRCACEVSFFVLSSWSWSCPNQGRTCSAS